MYLAEIPGEHIAPSHSYHYFDRFQPGCLLALSAYSQEILLGRSRIGLAYQIGSYIP